MNHRVRAAGPFEYFCRKVRLGRPDECWEWQGSLSSNGYGNWSAPGQKKEQRTEQRTSCFTVRSLPATTFAIAATIPNAAIPITFTQAHPKTIMTIWSGLGTESHKSRQTAR